MTAYSRSVSFVSLFTVRNSASVDRPDMTYTRHMEWALKNKTNSNCRIVIPFARKFGSSGVVMGVKLAAATDFFQCCFTSTETIRTIRDGEPRTATSIFTQLLGGMGC